MCARGRTQFVPTTTSQSSIATVIAGLTRNPLPITEIAGQTRIDIYAEDDTMPSLTARFLRTAIRVFWSVKPERFSIQQQRRGQDMIDVIIHTPRDVKYEPFTAGALPLAWLFCGEPSNSGAVVLHLHGGGYMMGGMPYCKSTDPVCSRFYR